MRGAYKNLYKKEIFLEIKYACNLKGIIIQSEICRRCIIILTSHCEIKLTDIRLELPLKILS